MSRTVRTFVAVEVPPEVRDRAMQLVHRLKTAEAKVKWVAPISMHWSLKFLGDVEMVEIPAVCAAVEKACAELAPFDVEARGAGAFPDIGNPRTVWLGVGQGAQEMIALHAAIERELAKLGYRAEGRKFRPHLTLGRMRNSPTGVPELGQLIQDSADFESGLSTVYEVVVMSSDLGRDGPTYEPLGHAELSRAPDSSSA